MDEDESNVPTGLMESLLPEPDVEEVLETKKAKKAAKKRAAK